MEQPKRTIKFVGGPLDGQVKELAAGETTYVFKEHPDLEDLTMVEPPVGYNPTSFELTYEESPTGSGVFILKE